MANTLNALERGMVSWIEVAYHQNKGVFPSFETFKSSWPTSFATQKMLSDFLSKPAVRQALLNRGIDTRPTKDLSEQQAAAILLVANLSDRRNLKTKLNSLGITLAQWNAWKKQPNFRGFLHSQLTDDFESSLDRALSGLLSAVDSGNPRAIELYLEMTGRQPTEAERNYRVAITRIVESITRHVRDPNTIRLLKEDFDRIEQGIDPNHTINTAAISPTPVESTRLADSL